MKSKVLMVQGTASHAGKSLLVTALCRIFRQDGFSVAPFKAQNMSLNSYATPDGGEIGRAQAVQAEAAGIEPMVEMNPILLKPEADDRSQVVVMGHPYATAPARDYYSLKSVLWPKVVESLEVLRSRFEIVVIEGAGSPAEINLKDDEIVNMRVARHAKSPVLLVGDIERGGVFASLVGTLELLAPEERVLVKGLIINKFRGDPSLLDSGLAFLGKRAGVPVIGVVPYLRDVGVAEEDSVSLEEPRKPRSAAPLDIAVISFPHMSNFDDFDPLSVDHNVNLRYVAAPGELGAPDLIILPGTKTTIADLDWLEKTGLAEKIRTHHDGGSYVVGICGGYQMLGERILDPERVESPLTERKGLGLLSLATVFLPSKETHQVEGVVKAGRGLLEQARGLPFQGYEIHMGRTDGVSESPFLIEKRSGRACQVPEGCLDSGGRVLGTYLHGLFNNAGLRSAILNHLASRKGFNIRPSPAISRDVAYDRLADHVRRSLNMDLIYAHTRGICRKNEI